MTSAPPPSSFPPGSTAILSALAEEQHGLIDLLQQPRQVTHTGRDFWLGDLHGQPVVLVDDIERARTTVEGTGGTISKPIFTFPGGRRFHFLDPNGLELAIIQTD